MYRPMHRSARRCAMPPQCSVFRNAHTIHVNPREKRGLPARVVGDPRMHSISPIFLSGGRVLGFVKERNGTVCGVRTNRDDGIGEHGYLVAFFSRFSPIAPPIFRHFPATCRARSYNFYRDLLTNPHFPPFSIFLVVPRRPWGLGDFGFGYPAAVGLVAGPVCRLEGGIPMSSPRAVQWAPGVSTCHFPCTRTPPHIPPPASASSLGVCAGDPLTQMHPRATL